MGQQPRRTKLKMPQQLTLPEYPPDDGIFLPEPAATDRPRFPAAQKAPDRHSRAVQKWKDEVAAAQHPRHPQEPATPAGSLPKQLKAGEKLFTELPFGKYSGKKGYKLKDVPTWYLKWFIDNIDDRKTGLHASIELEIWSRADRDDSGHRSSGGYSEYSGPKYRKPRF